MVLHGLASSSSQQSRLVGVEPCFITLCTHASTCRLVVLILRAHVNFNLVFASDLFVIYYHINCRPYAIRGITSCHKVRHSLSLPIVTYICMRELPHFRHGPKSSFLHTQPIQTPPSGPVFICAAGQMFIWDDPSATPLS